MQAAKDAESYDGSRGMVEAESDALRRIAQRLVVTLERCSGCETHQHCTNHKVRYLCQFPRCAVVCADEASWAQHNRRAHGNYADHLIRSKYDDYACALQQELGRRLPGVRLRTCKGQPRLGAFEITAFLECASASSIQKDGVLAYTYSKIASRKWPRIDDHVGNLISAAIAMDRRLTTTATPATGPDAQHREGPISLKSDAELCAKSESQIAAVGTQDKSAEDPPTRQDDHAKDVVARASGEETGAPSADECKTRDGSTARPSSDPAALFLDVSALLDAGGSLSSSSYDDDAFSQPSASSARADDLDASIIEEDDADDASEAAEIASLASSASSPLPSP